MSNSPCTVARFMHELEAGMLVNELERNGIEAWATGAALAGFRAEAPASIDVTVRSSDLKRAKVIHQELAASAPSVDWESVDVGQPEDHGDRLHADQPSHQRFVSRSMLVHQMLFLVALVIMLSIACCVVLDLL